MHLRVFFFFSSSPSPVNDFLSLEIYSWPFRHVVERPLPSPFLIWEPIEEFIFSQHRQRQQFCGFIRNRNVPLRHFDVHCTITKWILFLGRVCVCCDCCLLPACTLLFYQFVNLINIGSLSVRRSHFVPERYMRDSNRAKTNVFIKTFCNCIDLDRELLFFGMFTRSAESNRISISLVRRRHTRK